MTRPAARDVQEFASLRGITPGISARLQAADRFSYVTNQIYRSRQCRHQPVCHASGLHRRAAWRRLP